MTHLTHQWLVTYELSSSIVSSLMGLIGQLLFTTFWHASWKKRKNAFIEIWGKQKNKIRILEHWSRVLTHNMTQWPMSALSCYDTTTAKAMPNACLAFNGYVKSSAKWSRERRPYSITMSLSVTHHVSSLLSVHAHSMRSRVYVTLQCQSICRSHHERFLGGQKISIDCCNSGVRRCECGQCHVVSVRR